MLYLSLLLIVTGTVAYNFFEKTLPREVNHYLYLIMTYVAALCCLISGLILSEYDIRNLIHDFNFESILVGFGAMFVDYGLIVAYQKGWKISILNITYTLCTFIILLSIGIFFFNEQLTDIKMAGIVLCVISIFLINYKQNVKSGRR